MERIFLSRRNLLTLLSKLDRAKDGESTMCTLIKYQNKDEKYVQTVDTIVVTAIEDEDYYTKRSPGEIHERDGDKIDEPV